MDNLLYSLLTNIVVFISLVGFVVILTMQFIKKKPLAVFIYVLLFIFICGLYLFIPSRYTYLGFMLQQPDLLKKAVKLSVNPYEKRLCRKYIAEIYANDIFNQGIKDGNKAIAYMEKALNGRYDKYQSEAFMLAYWYSVKGDYQKTTDICKVLKSSATLPLRNIYILNNEYNKALTTFSDNNKGVENFLRSALYKKIGNNKEALRTENIAKKAYNSQMNAIKEKSKQMEFQEQSDKYKTVEAYKSWLEAQSKEFKFK